MGTDEITLADIEQYQRFHADWISYEDECEVSPVLLGVAQPSAPRRRSTDSLLLAIAAIKAVAEMCALTDGGRRPCPGMIDPTN